MSKPLSHSGKASYYGNIGDLVYPSGQPQKIAIIREFKKTSSYPWDTRVLVEYQSGKKVWAYGGHFSLIDDKIQEEKRALAAFEKARDEAKQHFGI